jgi:hypothetical protein
MKTKYLVLSFILITLVLVSCKRSTDKLLDKSLSFVEARKQFKTQLLDYEYVPDGDAAIPPGHLLEKIEYPSIDGNLVAYITPAPQDQKKHPILIWARSGHGGIGEWLWEKGFVIENAIQKGLLVMTPSWRQDNANPGTYSLFFGEIDDTLAAIEYVKSLPYVDSSRIYFA